VQNAKILFQGGNREQKLVFILFLKEGKNETFVSA